MPRQPRVSAAAGVTGPETKDEDGHIYHAPSCEVRVEFDNLDASAALAALTEVVAVVTKQIEGAR